MKITSLLSLFSIGFFYCLSILSDVQHHEENKHDKYYNPYYLSIDCLAHLGCYLSYKENYVMEFHFFSYSYVYEIIEYAKKIRKNIIYYPSRGSLVNEKIKISPKSIDFKFVIIQKKDFNYDRPSYFPFSNKVRFSINKKKNVFVWLNKEMFDFVIQHKHSSQFLVNIELFSYGNSFNYLTIGDFIRVPAIEHVR